MNDYAGNSAHQYFTFTLTPTLPLSGLPDGLTVTFGFALPALFAPVSAPYRFTTMAVLSLVVIGGLPIDPFFIAFTP